MRLFNSYLLIFSTFYFSCNENTSSSLKQRSALESRIVELTDSDYPDNPDIEIRSELDGSFSHSSVLIKEQGKGLVTLTIIPNNNESDTLIVPNILIEEFIPFCPKGVSDNYISRIGIINQEWNRQQVKFIKEQFYFKGNNNEHKIITRVDIARNCLNAYLWEIIGYTDIDGEMKPCYHGWFNFPKEYYHDQFEKRNGKKWSDFSKGLVNWKDPESKHFDLSKLRTVQEKLEIQFSVENDGYYPLIGERKKKFKNIIYPHSPSCINDFLTDSTAYGTFSPPGYYNTKDPRRTELGRLKIIEMLELKTVSSALTKKDSLIEVSISFSDNDGTRKTKLIIGGIEVNKIPMLSIERMNNGFQMPMGIANHSFYETYEECLANMSVNNPYYGLFLDEEGKWLDSHKIGIDGPLMYFDENDPSQLHLWLLSFERHSFVGHYVIDCK